MKEQPRLVRILRSGELEEPAQLTDFGKSVIEPTLANYPPGDAEPAWPSFMLVECEQAVGGGGFKTAPQHGEVEIAYFTSPEFEGRGYAGQTASLLIERARAFNPRLTVTAETLMEENASVRILRRLGFEQTEVRIDPDERIEVWHWKLRP